MTELHGRRGGSTFAAWVVCTLLLVFLYLANLGPCCWFEEHGGMNYETLELVYFPIVWIDDHSDFFQVNPAGQVYAAYVELWCD